MTSAYPTPVDTLETKVRNWAVELGEMPSRNQVMKRFKVGAPKASAALDAVRNSRPSADVRDLIRAVNPKLMDKVEAAERASEPPQEMPVARLHSVPTDHATTVEAPPAAAPPATLEPFVSDVVEHAGTGGDGSILEASVTAQAGRNPVDGEASRPAGWEASPVAGGQASPAPDPLPGDGSTPRGMRHADTDPQSERGRARVASWPLLLLALPAFVAVWGGWVGLGELTGFGPVRLLPGIADHFVINSAITLPIGVEAYAAYALRVWLSGATRSTAARRFARWSAIGSLVLGALGQVAYHLMEAAGVTTAPWWITTFVSVLPVVVLGCGAALTHLLHHDRTEDRR